MDQTVFDQFTQQTGIRVDFIPGPESMTERLDLYRRYLGSQSGTPDVYYLDVVWPAVLADEVVDLNQYLAKEAADQLETQVQNDTVDGKLTSMPFNTELGVLYYRADLVRKYGYSHPPGTWDELEKMAARIQAGERAAGNHDFWGYVWQGAAYEGLTCNALEWEESYGGGDIIEADGSITVNNPRTIEALQRARGWIGRISPPSVVAFKEQDSRNVLYAGNAAFARDWLWRQFSDESLLPKIVESGAETVLLVEDELALRDLIKIALTGHGFSVLDVGNPADAITVCRNHTAPLHLLLTDVIMPGMDGPALAKQVQIERPDIKVPYMSGYASNFIMHDGVVEPGTTFLEKPFHPRALLYKVREVLDSSNRAGSA
jgi:CheY-like chemotaxis protein